MKQAVFAAGLLVLLGACASAPAGKPTHYWESSSASTNKYRLDEQNCQKQASGDARHFPEFAADSDSYDAYRSCMVSRGYVLREY
jgi:hypothetical protein